MNLPYLRAFAYADKAKFTSTFVNLGPCNKRKFCNIGFFLLCTCLIVSLGNVI